MTVAIALTWALVTSARYFPPSRSWVGEHAPASVADPLTGTTATERCRAAQDKADPWRLPGTTCQVGSVPNEAP